MTDNIKEHLLMEAESEMNPSIKDKFFGEYHINVENIVEPEGDNTQFRVRDVDMDTVDKLCQNMIKSVDLPFNAAPMIVLAFEDTKHSLTYDHPNGFTYLQLGRDFINLFLFKYMAF